MSETLATYSFLPWLRQGIANNITTADNDASVILRASIDISLNVAATGIDGTQLNQPVNKTIEIYGPGDIVGIDSKAIVKTEPRNWITNFESNYFPFIEFYDEDFPWRYTPAFPDTSKDRLRPWLTLVVLKEDEFEDGNNMQEKPLPYFKMKDGKKAVDIFPIPSELWAWSHVHVNTDLSDNAAPGEADPAAVNIAVTNLIQQNPDYAYSRIICPRKLEPNIGYYAFLLPTFESGRLSGLGLDLPTDLVATKCGWDDEVNVEFPYYYRWYFRTGNMGDFEYLVNLLQPKTVDKSVGVRNMDVLHPGSNLPGIDDSELSGILRLGGALRVPTDTLTEEDKAEVKKYDEWDENPYPHPFVTSMAGLINLGNDYTNPSKTVEQANLDMAIVSKDDSAKGDPDPVITSPLYGRWHALQQRLLKDSAGNELSDNKNWIHELNLDPRFRVSAGLGTKVIQKGQEEYMQAAWQQVGDIVEANNKIRLAQMAKEVSTRYYAKHMLTLEPERAFVFTAPVQKRIVYENLTVHKQVQQSMVPSTVVSGTFRSISRPRGTLMKKLKLANPVNFERNTKNFLERINNGELIIAPPRTDSKGAINLTDLAVAAQPENIPVPIANALKNYTWFRFLPLLVWLLLILICLLFGIAPWIMGMLTIAAVSAFTLLNKWNRQLQAASMVSQSNQTPESVDSYPSSLDFVISSPGSGFTPAKGNTDSQEALNLKTALRDLFTFVNIKFAAPDRKKLDITGITDHVITSLNPALTIPKRLFTTIQIPSHIKDNMVETFTQVMAYPVIDRPMYKPLAEMSSELFLPNINRIEPNSITLLENNQKFIEAYMVGINHEMSRELLWREYPTDQRGTYFRQFWDVNSFLSSQPAPDDLAESLRDIPPIHQWYKTASLSEPDRNQLGQHNQRALDSGKTQLVLVVRGELLKKYPTAVIYAQKAEWGTHPVTGNSDINQERVLTILTADEEKNPPQSKLKTPLFEAKIEPDIYFFGFDLDDEEARGATGPTSVSDDPGWFFVFREREGEPKFGLDIEKAKNSAGEEKIINWNNLSWKDIGTQDGACINLSDTGTISFAPYSLANDQENVAIADDVQAKWNPDTNAAELAYILYQVPVLVAVHASRMLPKNN